ncbi:MAG: hypothetical protein WD847_14775 [Pirellulales bacterium]
MKYTVVWRPVAEAELAELWSTATARDAIAIAADDIDAMLARDPLSCGESRRASTRILVVAPLAALYSVSEDDQLVAVLAVWRWGRAP